MERRFKRREEERFCHCNVCRLRMEMPGRKYATCFVYERTCYRYRDQNLISGTHKSQHEVLAKLVASTNRASAKVAF